MPRILRGLIALSLMALFTSVLFVGLLMAGLLACLVPWAAGRRYFKGVANAFPGFWTRSNAFIFACLMTLKIEVDESVLSNLSTKEWYLLIANHQSWTDILILFHVFHGRIPVLKFFIKNELKWLPLIGWGCWILDYPFVYRYTKAFLKKHPEKAGSDLANTKKACEKFKWHPTTIVNFMEGTRLTPAKHSAQESPYQHLLNPRAGGAAYVLSILGNTLHKLLNVTIVYDRAGLTFWQFLCSPKNDIKVKMIVSDIEPDWCGDYQQDIAHRKQFQKRIKTLWQEKDSQIQQLRQEFENEKNTDHCNATK